MGTKRKEINFTNQELSDYIERRIFMPELAAKYGVNKDTIRYTLIFSVKNVGLLYQYRYFLAIGWVMQ